MRRKCPCGRALRRKTAKLDGAFLLLHCAGVRQAPRNSPPTPLPGWITPDVIADTCSVFEPLYGHPLADDDVTEILLNVGNLFRILGTPGASGARPRRSDSVSPPKANGDRRRARRRTQATTKEPTNAIRRRAVALRDPDVDPTLSGAARTEP
jgi:hypothetical protein